MADRSGKHGGACTCPRCRPMLQDLGGTGHLYRTRPEWSVTEWHWACVICEKNGHDFDSAALALQGFYRHRASVHGLSPAPRELREPPVLLQLTTGVRAAPAQRLGSQAAPGGAGELYRTSAGSGLEWHWSCFVCGESGHESRPPPRLFGASTVTGSRLTASRRHPPLARRRRRRLPKS